jgi:hypothetical protein
MILRVHQEGGAGIAGETKRVLGMLFVLDVSDWTNFFNAVAADDKSTALEGKLAFCLRHDSIQRIAREGDGLHD